MARSLLLIVAGGVLLLLTACSGDPGTGVKEVKWDRDACERCRMVLSDRFHSAQVRFSPAGGKRSKVLKFDDIGCAALWLEDKPFRDDPKTEIWVTDHRSGDWIDATKAHYVKGHLTPMEYGLGAQTEATPGSLTYAQAQADIQNSEEHYNAHGIDLLKRYEEQKKRREATRAAAAAQTTDKTDR
ncbi:MAG: hypothetical protein ABW168_21240 [Sedimenticola sp.]